jgi:hypothetical protein
MKNFVRLILMMVISFMMAINVNGQTILCVDRDFDDSAGVFTDTWPMIQSALDAMGYTYDYWEVINFEDNGPDANYMGSYDAVIWFTGEAWTDGATMGPEDEFNLVLYMAFGGKLFMNAQDWLYDRYTSYGTFSEGEFPYDNLGIIEVVQDVYHIEPEDPSAIADSAQFYGSPGSLAEGLVFPVVDIFTIDEDEGLYGDSIAQHMGLDLLSIQQPYNSPGPAAIQYETAAFRSVFTTIDIAAIKDTIARNVFLDRILDWLIYGPTGVSEMNTGDVDLVIRPNPVSEFVEIGMIDRMEEVSIFNSQGQMVRHEEVNKPGIRMDLGSLTPGMYVVKVKTGQGMVTSKLLKK